MWPNPQETADLVTFTEEILIGKLLFFVQCDGLLSICTLWCTLTIFCYFIYIFFMSQSRHIALFSYCTFFMTHFIGMVALLESFQFFSGYVLLSCCFYRVACSTTFRFFFFFIHFAIFHVALSKLNLEGSRASITEFTLLK